jgi:penicillin V acylase-like amidase (Ntn superfamily)
MTRWVGRLGLGLLVVAALGAGAEACSTFCLVHDGQVVVGNSYDWMVDDGMVVVNKRGVWKMAMVMDTPAQWTSRYGSVTFNQYGREFPIGGMNEAGLVATLMWLNGTQYPAPDERGAVGSLQWIQYQLDTAGKVEEVIANQKRIRVGAADPAPLHYFVADRSGKCAVVEYIGGETRCYSGKELRATALTNTSYAEAVAYLRGHAGFGGSAEVACTPGSRDRFVCAAARVRDYDAQRDGPAAEYALETLRRVRQGNTVWNIVYEPSASRIRFLTRAASDVRSIDLRKLDFACGTPVKVLDMNAALSGDVTGRLEDYTPEANRALVTESYGQTPALEGMPEMIVDMSAQYPASTVCQTGAEAVAE